MASAVKNTISKVLGATNGSAPNEPSTSAFDQLRNQYTQAGQGQVFNFWDSLNAAEKASLFAQLKDIDPEHINELDEKRQNTSVDLEAGSDAYNTLPESKTSSILDSNPADLKQWYESGLDYVSQNKVAVVLMAGGQGTRLGASGPKGCFDIGLESHKSLFQLQAERIFKVQQLAAKQSGQQKPVVVPWYIMTSGPTRAATDSFLKENNYFGLKEENVTIFEQGVLPCITDEGKIILESKSKVN
jgi:UDP-N-acetylglucosamine/UDP-N-acetylgalactosamine diphosphorylase